MFTMIAINLLAIATLFVLSLSKTASREPESWDSHEGLNDSRDRKEGQ